MPLRLEGTDPPIAEANGREVSILLVEDSEDDVLLTLRALRKSVVEQEQIVVMPDGEEAQDFLFSRGAYESRNGALMPKLVLLDINLPRLSGIELLRSLRADLRTRILPIVMLTSSAAEKDLLSCYGAGANGYIQKPVNSSDFEVTVQKVVNYWLGINRAPGCWHKGLMAEAT